MCCHSAPVCGSAFPPFPKLIHSFNKHWLVCFCFLCFSAVVVVGVFLHHALGLFQAFGTYLSKKTETALLECSLEWETDNINTVINKQITGYTRMS